MAYAPVVSNAAQLGELLGATFGVYVVFLFLGCLGVHWLLLLGYFALRNHPRLRFPIELGYGLVNPAAYLFVFQPTCFSACSPSWYVGLCATTLVAYWTFRLFGAGLPFEGAVARLVVPPLLSACFFLSLFVLLRALAIHPDAFSGPLFVLGLLPLYLLPLIAPLAQLKNVRATSEWK